MGNTYGYQVVGAWGNPIQVAADSEPEFKAGGITVDWTKVAVLNAENPVTLQDGVIVPVNTQALPGGTILAVVTATGMYGPADTTATDGRQTLARGTTFIVNRTVLITDQRSNHPEALEGGVMWKDRILSLASLGIANAVTQTPPTQAALEAVLPRMRYAAV